MSATNRGSVKITQEFYPTPNYTVSAILAEIDWNTVKSFTEPCRGAGHISNLIPSTVSKNYCELSEGTDYLTTSMPKVDLVVTNPPFTLAQEFVVKSRTEARCVIILQRLNYLGSKTRKKFWNKNTPTHLFVLSDRPKFVAKCNKAKCKDNLLYQILIPQLTCNTCGKPVTPQSDATEYAWFVWDSITNPVILKPPGLYVL